MNKKSYRYIPLIILAIGLFVYSLIMYIKSYSFYQDEYGTDISFNSDYLVLLIVAIVWVYYFIYSFVKGKDQFRFNLLGGLSTFTLSFYALGVALKAINKQEELNAYLNYLVFGGISLFLLVYFILSYLENKRSKI